MQAKNLLSAKIYFLFKRQCCPGRVWRVPCLLGCSGGSSRGAAVPGQPGGGRGRAAGPRQGRDGPAACRRPDGLSGLPQVDGQGTEPVRFQFWILEILIKFNSLKHC